MRTVWQRTGSDTVITLVTKFCLGIKKEKHEIMVKRKDGKAK